MFADAADRGAVSVIRDRLSAGERLPGFGHTVYRTGDPRLSPLLEAVRRLPDAERRLDVVDGVLVEASVRVTPRPNVDFGLAALAFVGGLDPDVPIFAVARLAGWAAHIGEELGERPLRFRGLANPMARTTNDRAPRPV
jgi:citrate synthase